MASYEKTPSTPLTGKHSSFSKGDLEGQNTIESLDSNDEKVVDDRTPAQKYSLQWWKKTWTRAIHVGMWPRVFYCVLGFVLVVGWVGVMLGLVGAEVKYEQQNGRGLAHRRDGHLSTINKTGEVSGLVMLKGTLVNFNVETRALTVTWSGLWLYDMNKDPVDLANEEDDNSVTYYDGIEIYRDISSDPYQTTYIWPSDNQTYTEWSYWTDNATAKPIAVIGRHSWDSFDTDITFSQRRPKDAWVQPSLGYPLDEWQGQIIFVANNLFLSRIFNETGGAVMTLAGIQLADSTLNWRFSYEYVDHCNPNDTEIDWNTTDISTLPPHCYLEVNFVGRRPPLLIFCAIAAVGVNWTCALFIFILTSEAIIMRRSYMLKGTDILSMCFTALFALPTIRSLLPGAPAYGAIIDLVGILPCTLIVALCAVCVSVAKLKKRYAGQKTE